MASGDIVIPMDQWVATVARLPNAAEIVRHGRTDAEALSAAELEGLDIDALAAELAGDTTEAAARAERSEEHTSELQSLMRISYAVFCLKKKNYTRHQMTRQNIIDKHKES